jgi:hypothetical protein
MKNLKDYSKDELVLLLKQGNLRKTVNIRKVSAKAATKAENSYERRNG